MRTPTGVLLARAQSMPGEVLRVRTLFCEAHGAGRSK